MLRTIRSPWVAVIRHSQCCPSKGGGELGGSKLLKLPVLSWQVLPHSDEQGQKLTYSIKSAYITV